MKHPEEFLYHGAGVQELTLSDVNNCMKEMTGLLSQHLLKVCFRTKTMKIFFNILVEI